MKSMYRSRVVRNITRVATLAIVGTAFWCGRAYAINDLLAGWSFEGGAPFSPTSVTGTTGSQCTADLGAQAAVAQMVGVHASASTLFQSVVGNGSGNSYSSNMWALGDYYQFQTATTGVSDLGIQFDHVSSTTGPRDWKVQYSLNGTTFTDAGTYSVGPNANPAWSSVAPVGPAGLDTYNLDLRSITAINNQANVYLRLTPSALTAAQQGSSFANTGTSRVDNFMIYNNFDPTQSPIEQPAATPVLPQAGDIVIGLGSGRQNTTLELVRGTIPGSASKPAPYSPWNSQNFIRFVKFDNLGSTAHNVAGNLIGVDPGGSATAGGNIYSLATHGSNPPPTPQLLATSNTASGAATRLGGLSVSPDNTKIALAGFDTGKVLVYDYTAGNGLGTGSPSLTGLRQSSAILGTGANYTAGGQQGTAWLNNSTVLAFAGDGKLYEVDAASMASTVKKDMAIATIAQSSTALAYNPAISPYVYAMYSGFASITTNKLYVFDPANNYNELTGGLDFSSSANTIRDISLAANGSLVLVTNASATGVATPNGGRLEYIPNVLTPGSITANSSVDWFTDDIFQSQPGFTGLDIGFATTALAGDYNGNGKVDAADYVLWRNDPASFGGDPAGYNTWRSNFGNGGAGSGAGVGAAAVPEAGSVALVLLGLSLCGMKRRGR